MDHNVHIYREQDKPPPQQISTCSLSTVTSVASNARASSEEMLLPDVAEDTVSPTRARTMKDFENQITDLKKENFNLKLRIYFLEERMQQKFDGPTEDIYKINIELKVEVESLKRDLQEREQLLIKASKAVESLAQGGNAEIQRVREEARKKVQQVEEFLSNRINLLEEDLKAAQAEVEKAFLMKEREKVLRLASEQQLSSVTNIHPKDLDIVTVLEEKERLVEQLNLSLKSKEAIIQHLEEEKSQSGSCDGSLSTDKIRELSVALRHEKDSEIEVRKLTGPSHIPCCLKFELVTSVNFLTACLIFCHAITVSSHVPFIDYLIALEAIANSSLTSSFLFFTCQVTVALFLASPGELYLNSAIYNCFI
uniref:Centrosomin N-terminal motif 1 domain-containing protein n=1 Tax=Sphenodon punctatus TaxID=8508 RepID=A0A8D0GK16_SPHPU